MKEKRKLIIGSNGQVGKELVHNLLLSCEPETIICADVKNDTNGITPFEHLDVLDKKRLATIIQDYGICEIYHLAAVLSARAEDNVESAWKLNMQGLINVLELGRAGLLNKIFWPSSIAVFGPNSPREMTPQFTVADPVTVYGITKVAGENLCNYYHRQFGVDVRSVRYPGLIGHRSLPGGGTTDYAVDIFYDALKDGYYDCFLSDKITLPMMYMDDAIRATIEIMEVNSADVKIRTSYNIAGFSFAPNELAAAIAKHVPGFKINYKPDFRQKIAEEWPASIDDSFALRDWGWRPQYDLMTMVEDMLENLKNKATMT